VKQHLKGLQGEQTAVRYLEERGYEVLDRNFRSRRGEVDVIVRKGGQLVFVEVKHWDAYGADSLEYAIDARKQRRIRQSGEFFIYQHPQFAELHIRFDVLLVKPEGIDHIKNAFDGV
jgi:putative endonuclease